MIKYPYNGVRSGVLDNGINVVIPDSGLGPFASLTLSGGATRNIYFRGTTGQQIFIEAGDGSEAETVNLNSGSDVLYSHAYASGVFKLKIYGALSAITKIVASGQGVQISAISRLSGLFYLNLYNGNLTAGNVDSILISLVAKGLSNGYLDLSGNNTARTLLSNTAVSTLVSRGWTIWVNQTNSETTIIGTDVVGPSGVPPATLALSKYIYSGSSAVTINSIDLYVAVSGQVKVSLYSNVAGEPKNLLSANNTSTSVTSAAWRRLPIPAYTLVPGTTYWLAFVSKLNYVGRSTAEATNLVRLLAVVDFDNWTAPSSLPDDIFPYAASLSIRSRV